VDEDPGTPAEVEALPLEERAVRYLAVQRRLEARLELPGA
jgi:hypothetical protein